MKATLTDHFTKKKVTIIYAHQYLPVIGDDGFVYMLFTSHLTNYDDSPRNDFTIIDMNEKIAIKVCTNAEKQPVKYDFNKEAFDKATTLEEYSKLKKKPLN